MKNRIPKKAQRQIDALARQRVEHAAKTAALPVPKKMTVGITPRGIMNQFDVYLNGERQLLCLEADVVQGHVRRYIAGIGNRPAKGSAVEVVFGKVEIRRKS